MPKLGNGTNFNLKDECINLSADKKIGNGKEFCLALIIIQQFSIKEEKIKTEFEIIFTLACALAIYLKWAALVRVR